MRHVRSRTCGGTGRPEPQWVRASQPLRRHRCRIPSYDRPPAARVHDVRCRAEATAVPQIMNVLPREAASASPRHADADRAPGEAGPRPAQGTGRRRCGREDACSGIAFILPLPARGNTWPGPVPASARAWPAEHPPAGRYAAPFSKTAARPPPWHQAAGQLRDLEQDNTYGDGTMAARETLFAPEKACVSGTAGAMGGALQHPGGMEHPG